MGAQSFFLASAAGMEAAVAPSAAKWAGGAAAYPPRLLEAVLPPSPMP